MLGDLGAAAVCKVQKMDPIGLYDSEGPGTSLRIRALVGRVMTKLEEITRLPERRLLEMKAIPFLRFLARQNHMSLFRERGDLPRQRGRG